MDDTSKNIVKRHHVDASTMNIYIIVAIVTHSSTSQQPKAIQKSTNQNHTSLLQIILKNITVAALLHNNLNQSKINYQKLHFSTTNI